MGRIISGSPMDFPHVLSPPIFRGDARGAVFQPYKLISVAYKKRA